MIRKLGFALPAACIVILSVVSSVFALSPQPLPPGARRDNAGATDCCRALPRPLFADGSMRFKR